MKELGTINNEKLKNGEEIMIDYSLFEKYKEDLNLEFVKWEYSFFGNHAWIKAGG